MLYYIRKFLPEFYADDGLIHSRSPVMLQEALMRLVALFERVSLKTNPNKTKAMTCIPGRIRTRLSDNSYANSRDGLTYARDWTQRRVNCDQCGVELAAGLMDSHL